MIRSLRTGVSGLKSNQVKMDVVGDNIANVNTVAFKRSRAAFNEVLGQQLLGVGRTAGGTGINPSFVGLGVAIGSIDKNWGQGALENTGVSTDLALSGDGFFIAKAGDRTLLTRAGNFTFNRSGELVTSTGLKVQGWGYDAAGNLITGDLQDVRIDFNAQAHAQATSIADISGNLSAEMAVGDSTSISTVIYDAQGSSHNMIIEFSKTAADAWDYTIRSSSNPEAFPPVTESITFDNAGNPTTGGTASVTWSTEYVDGGAAINIDLTKLRQTSGSTTAAFRDQDGSASGSLIGYSINPEGVVELSFTNGEQQKLFQLAIGAVNNPQGLEQQGENFYLTTSASGSLQLGRAGRDLRTAVVAGTLETSNVDLATEFTEMIVAQRGYQAAARIITVSDELMQETVQLKR